MSGTSMDGIDLSIISSDGHHEFSNILDDYYEYDKNLQDQLVRLRDLVLTKKDLLQNSEKLRELERNLTLFHGDAVNQSLKKYRDPIDLIGFHGHTISHNPDEQHTLQIGNGRLLASATGVDVVNDLRSSDVKAGGQGAPLAPIYHKALMKSQDLPAIILNIGGVANITWVDTLDENLIGFDTGPGNALIDDWIKRKTGHHYDNDGFLASKGQVHKGILTELLASH